MLTNCGADACGGQKPRAFPELGAVCENRGHGIMMEDKYRIQQELADLKRNLDSDPTNVEAASRYWVKLASFGGNDVRSGGFVSEAFRRCALASPAGAVAFARAYRELFEKSGEKSHALNSSMKS
jgi:hypothetical protein